MWWEIAAAAAPYLIGLTQKRPDRPVYSPPPSIQLPDRSAYFANIMNDAFNPGNETFNYAADVAQERINRMLGRSGMTGSSFGVQASADQMNQLVRDYASDAFKKKMMATQLMTDYDKAAAAYEAGQYMDRYRADLAAYKDRIERQNEGIKGISGLIGGVANIVARDQAIKENRDWLENFMNRSDASVRLNSLPFETGYGSSIFNQSSYVPSYSMPSVNSGYNLGLFE